MILPPAAPTLVYVEDEFLIQEMLVTGLTDAGFIVLAASNGAEALAIFAEKSEQIDGLITDINLGDGADGWELARTARQLKSHLPVVYVSATGEGEWNSQGVPASVMIAKPFVAAQVVVAISSLLTVSD